MVNNIRRRAEAVVTDAAVEALVALPVAAVHSRCSGQFNGQFNQGTQTTGVKVTQRDVKCNLYD